MQNTNLGRNYKFALTLMLMLCLSVVAGHCKKTIQCKNVCWVEMLKANKKVGLKRGGKSATGLSAFIVIP